LKALLIDAGNSRLKWQLLRGRRRGPVQALAWNAGGPQGVVGRVLAAAGAVDEVLVCCVGGNAVEQALRVAVRRAGLRAPRFVRSARRAAGVINGYIDPWRLGADRWVALIGARGLRPRRALCVVDVGTAMTIDLLDAHGRHRGGLIVPGPTLMVETLLAHTAGIRRRAGGAVRGRGRGLFARRTRAGLEQGGRHACAALIERARRDARRLLGKRPGLLLAGGGADAIAPLIQGHWTRVDDLVLRGLAVLAAARKG
jgi:type III pantothenate kinase